MVPCFLCGLFPSSCPLNVSVSQVLARALFSLHIFFLTNPTHPLNFSYYLHVNDFQISNLDLTSKPNPDFQPYILKCLKGISTWKIYKCLKINMSKTEIIPCLRKSNSIPIFSQWPPPPTSPIHSKTQSFSGCIRHLLLPHYNPIRDPILLTQPSKSLLIEPITSLRVTKSPSSIPMSFAGITAKAS